MVYLFGVLVGVVALFVGVAIIRYSVRIARFVLSIASIDRASPSGVADWYVKGHGVIIAFFGLLMLWVSLRAGW